jgi:hypothetical protein
MDTTIDHTDFFYVLRDHGWSSCLIYVNGKVYAYDLTHIFENPIEILLSHLTGFINGENEVTFRWNDEPGHHQVTISSHPENKHLMRLTVTCSHHKTSNSPENLDLHCQTNTKIFMTSVLKQMEKIRDTMKERNFQDDRATFPFSEFNSFNQAFKNRYSQ